MSQVGTQVGGIALPLLAVSVLGAGELEMGLLATLEAVAVLPVLLSPLLRMRDLPRLLDEHADRPG